MSRMSIGDYRKIIHGRQAYIFFTWHNYTPANYREDFEAYKTYLENYYILDADKLRNLKHSALFFPEEAKFLETMAEEIEFDLVTHSKEKIDERFSGFKEKGIKELKDSLGNKKVSEMIDKEVGTFEGFRKVCEEKVAEMIISLFEEYSDLMPPGDSKKPNAPFSVEIDIESVKDRDWYFTHFFKKAKDLLKMNEQIMPYKFSGHWLLHNIFIPECHLPDDKKEHHEDAKVAILQQLKEHQDAVEQTLLDDTKLGAELKTYLKAGDSRNVRYLYMTIHGVWSAILSEFYATYNAKKFIIIPPGAIHNYRRLLDILTTQPQNKVTAFYEQYIGYSNVGPSGEYSMGKIMGGIAVAAASEDAIGNSGRKPYDIFIDGNKIETKNLRDRSQIINDAISNRREVRLGNFDPLIVNKVLATIRAEKNFLRFIEYSENCFKVLNIDSENQIFNKNMFNSLLNKANERKKK